MDTERHAAQPASVGFTVSFAERDRNTSQPVTAWAGVVYRASLRKVSHGSSEWFCHTRTDHGCAFFRWNWLEAKSRLDGPVDSGPEGGACRCAHAAPVARPESQRGCRSHGAVSCHADRRVIPGR